MLLPSAACSSPVARKRRTAAWVVGPAPRIPGSAFATVRQRVARHLLDLASARVGPAATPGQEASQELVARVSQQELADAVGTVREVVVRVLRELRQDRVVRTERDRIVLLEPARLIQEQAWNQGS